MQRERDLYYIQERLKNTLQAWCFPSARNLRAAPGHNKVQCESPTALVLSSSSSPPWSPVLPVSICPRIEAYPSALSRREERLRSVPASGIHTHRLKGLTHTPYATVMRRTSSPALVLPSACHYTRTASSAGSTHRERDGEMHTEREREA